MQSKPSYAAVVSGELSCLAAPMQQDSKDVNQVDWCHLPTKAEIQKLIEEKVLCLAPTDIRPCDLNVIEILRLLDSRMILKSTNNFYTDEDIDNLEYMFQFKTWCMENLHQDVPIASDVGSNGAVDALIQQYEQEMQWRLNPQFWQQLISVTSDQQWKNIFESMHYQHLYRCNWMLFSLARRKPKQQAAEAAVAESGFFSSIAAKLWG